MKLISVNCPNCGAPINIDLDNISKFCGKCGSKILLDIDQLQYILAEKEKTKQIEITEQTKRAELDLKRTELEHKIKYEKATDIGIAITGIILFVIAIVITILICLL